MSVFAFTSILECAPQFAKQPPLSKACLPGENSGATPNFWWMLKLMQQIFNPLGNDCILPSAQSENKTSDFSSCHEFKFDTQKQKCLLASCQV